MHSEFQFGVPITRALEYPKPVAHFRPTATILGHVNGIFKIRLCRKKSRVTRTMRLQIPCRSARDVLLLGAIIVYPILVQFLTLP